MPTLDDLPYLAKLAAPIQASDLLPISETSLTGATSRIRAVPAALATQGFTHLYVINFDHPLIRATAAAGTATIDLLTIPAAGRFVIEKVKMVCTRNFAAPTGLTSATVTVLDTQGSPVTYVAGIDADSTTAAPFARLYNVATTVASASNTNTQSTLANNVVIRTTVALAGTATGANLTAGQIVIALAVHDLNDYADIVTPLA